MAQQQNDVLERELHIAARPETVFAFFTDPAKMISWMGQEATLDPRPGGICLINIHSHITRGEYVELLPHSRIVFTWGWEDEGYPSERQKQFARRMIDAGASLVVGSHPHVTQGAESYRGRPIVYSLGNFLFNGFDTPATTTGWVLSVRMNKAGMIDWRTRVARLDANGVPHPDLTAASPCGKAGVPTISECRGK
jgi:uncharacterized protein YndB with AHSA1/START domain